MRLCLGPNSQLKRRWPLWTARTKPDSSRTIQWVSCLHCRFNPPANVYAFLYSVLLYRRWLSSLLILTNFEYSISHDIIKFSQSSPSSCIKSYNSHLLSCISSFITHFVLSSSRLHYLSESARHEEGNIKRILTRDRDPEGSIAADERQDRV